MFILKAKSAISWNHRYKPSSGWRAKEGLEESNLKRALEPNVERYTCEYIYTVGRDIVTLNTFLYIHVKRGDREKLNCSMLVVIKRVTVQSVHTLVIYPLPTNRSNIPTPPPPSAHRFPACRFPSYMHESWGQSS